MTNEEMFEISFQRPSNYFSLPAQTQWEIDKALGILDWEGGHLTEAELERFHAHYNVDEVDPLQWKNSCFGKPERTLYIGGIYAGTVDEYPADHFMNGRCWRAWISSDEDGQEVGWFASEGEAKAALLSAVQTALASVI